MICRRERSPIFVICQFFSVSKSGDYSDETTDRCICFYSCDAYKAKPYISLAGAP